SSSITDGLDGAADKSIEGIGKAVVEGGKAAGGAIDKTVDEFKNNEELQKYTGIALGAGGLPIAMASGVALSPVASSAAVAIANRVAMTPGAQDVIDFAKGANPISGVAPNPKNISEAAGAIISEFVQRNSR
ncbi:hypothetical protein, partial [Maridesulfovibrio frigidus]|uniref:hypothetical protein n=1 Tax=Maridesulfovibrio frigidus TaxID=340956 RepID=UPI0005563023